MLGIEASIRIHNVTLVGRRRLTVNIFNLIGIFLILVISYCSVVTFAHIIFYKEEN